jgi:hypothetical protein
LEFLESDRRPRFKDAFNEIRFSMFIYLVWSYNISMI